MLGRKLLATCHTMITGSLPNPEQTAQRLLKRSEIDAPPVNLRRVLSVWEGLSLVEEELDGAGYLLPLGRLGAEIIVNKNDRDERKRFTIAHELGHWVLGLACEKKLGEFKQPPGIPKVALERWCDTFAASLLMPASLVTELLPPKDQPLLIEAILRAAKSFRVSEEAFFIRIWELFRIQVAVLSSMRPVVVQKTYSDVRSEKDLLTLLRDAKARKHLEIAGPMIYFALSSASGPISVSGKRSAKGRVILAVAWPRP